MQLKDWEREKLFRNEPMKYYICRHAQTDANSTGQLSCEHDEVLNKTGAVQAWLFSDYLLSIDIDALWVSPLPRAVATIEPYCSKTKHRMSVMPFLAEGKFNLDPNAPISKPKYDASGFPVQNETIGQFRGRVKEFIERIMDNKGEGTVIVMTHGQFIREFLNMFLKAERYVRWPVDNCSETLIEIAGDIFIKHVNKRTI